MLSLRLSNKGLVQHFSRRFFASATPENQDLSRNQDSPRNPEEKHLVDRDDPKKVVVRGVTGTVVGFDSRKLYGFIKRDDTGTEILCHVDGIVRNVPARYTIQRGLKVEFDVVTTRKGLSKATAVTLPGGHPIENTYYIDFKRNKRPDLQGDTSEENNAVKKLFGELETEADRVKK